MKEKKKVTKIEEMPSKGKIAAAWFFLIILIGCTAGLVYLKNFKGSTTETQNEEIPETISPAITTVLTDIVDKFNNNTLVNDYKTEDLTLTASLQNATITVNYATTTANGNIQYTYNQMTANLTTTFETTDKEINDKVYKTMILACRDRLGLTEDVTSKIDEFINGTTEAPGLKKETTGSDSTYYINIMKPLEEETTTTNETTDNNEETNQTTPDNSNDNNSNITSSTIENNEAPEEQTTTNENTNTNDVR